MLITTTYTDPRRMRELRNAGTPMDGAQRHTHRPDIARADFDEYADERDAEGRWDS